MGNVIDNKFTMVIKDLCSLQSKVIESDKFVIGGCKWRLAVCSTDADHRPTKHLTLLLAVADFPTLPRGWSIHARYRLTVVNQLSERLSQVKETQLWFYQTIPVTGFTEMIPLSKLHDKDGGFFANEEVKIVAEVNVLEVIGNLNVSVESREATQPLKKTKLNDDGDVSSHLHKGTSSVKETIDVNGFQVLPSQVESVKRIFEKHPNMTLQLRAKNQTARTACMNALLSLIQTLCQSLQDLSIDDLGQAENELTYLKNSGFKVDWLERKLEEVKEKKIKEEIGETRMQELEDELKDIVALLEKNKEERKNLKKKCSDTKALLKKEKAKVLAARAPPLTLEDVV